MESVITDDCLHRHHGHVQLRAVCHLILLTIVQDWSCTTELNRNSVGLFIRSLCVLVLHSCCSNMHALLHHEHDDPHLVLIAAVDDRLTIIRIPVKGAGCLTTTTTCLHAIDAPAIQLNITT